MTATPTPPPPPPLPPDAAGTPGGEPRPDSMRQPPAPPAPPVAVPLPFYRRFWFWLLIGILLGVLAVALLAHLRPDYLGLGPQKAAEVELVPPSELLDVQRSYNKGLEEEVRRLEEALKADPCDVAALLGLSPDKAPLAPGYPAAPKTPGSDGIPKTPGGNGTQGTQGGTPGMTGGNGTSGAQSAPGNDASRKMPTPTPTAAPVPGTVSELMDNATVFILAEGEEGLAMGSGFLVAPGVVATNRHVVQHGTSGVYAGNKLLGGMHQVRVIAVSNDESRDFALLRLDASSAAKLPVLRIAPGASRTERVSAWGFPGFITEADPKLEQLMQGDGSAVPEVVYSEGVVSVVLERTPPLILHTATLSQGNSGGPLVNSQGEVVGINSFIKTADKSYSQTSIALPGADLIKFMQESGVTASTPAK